jgi:hypothetical protein
MPSSFHILVVGMDQALHYLMLALFYGKVHFSRQVPKSVNFRVQGHFQSQSYSF